VQANKEGTAKSKKALVNMPQFHNLMLMLEEFADNAGFNHPKLQKVEELVLQHFRTWLTSHPAADATHTHTHVFVVNLSLQRGALEATRGS
jgi:pantoate kinase